MIDRCLFLVVRRWSLPHGHARTNVGGSCPHSDSGTDVKPLIQDTHTHTQYLHTQAHTHSCPSYVTSAHTFHEACEPSPLIKSSSMRQLIRKRFRHRTARQFFCNKIINEIMVSKEQHDEHDSAHLPYSPAQLHLFLFPVPRLPVDQ